MRASRSLNVLLAGNEAAGVLAFRAILASPHQLVGVLAPPDSPHSRTGLWQVAREAGVTTLPARQIRSPDFAAWMTWHDVDVLLNVHSLYRVPAEVLAACRVGAFNLHPGPLPEYAGLDAPGWAIYHGESSHGVTLHRMDARVDAGDIISASRFPISSNDTGLTVMSRCVRDGIPLLRKLLDDLARDPSSVTGTPQDLSRRRWFSRTPPNGGRLDWNRTARQIVNHIRAADYSPFPSPWGAPRCSDGARDVGIVRAVLTHEAASAPPGTVVRVTDDGTCFAAVDLLVEVRLVDVGTGRPVPAAGVFPCHSRWSAAPGPALAPA